MTHAPLNHPVIAVCNDDGIDAEGLWVLVEAVAPLGAILIAAPTQEHSWAGRGHRSDTPHAAGPGRVVNVEPRDWRYPAPQYVACLAVGGSPALCAAIACGFSPRPTLLVSGINNGYNVGSLITASGTVGAAWEAASSGVPAIAFSTDGQIADRAAFVGHVRRIIADVLDRGLPEGAGVLNVNIPSSATADTETAVTTTCSTPLRVQKLTWYENSVRLESVYYPGADAGSDREALDRGRISMTYLPYRYGIVSET